MNTIIIKKKICFLTFVILIAASSKAFALCGDVSGDGQILSNDVLMVARASIGTLTLTAEQKARADVAISPGAPDGLILSNDLLIIARASLGMVTPICSTGVGRITGYVVDEKVTDQSGITVVVESVSAAAGRTATVKRAEEEISRGGILDRFTLARIAEKTTRTTTTDSEGKFTVEDLPPGLYTACAIKVPDVQNPNCNDVTSDPSKYNSPDLLVSVPQPIEITSDHPDATLGNKDEATGEITPGLKVKKTGTITGTATLSGATNHLGILCFVPGTSFMAVTDTSGNYAMTNVPEGTYTLACTKSGYEDTMATGIVVTEQQTVTATAITLAAQTQCTLYVTSITASPTSVFTGRTTAITVNATSSSCGALSYSYSAEGAISGSGSSVIWTAPDTAGIYTIYVTVTDGSKYATSQIAILVNKKDCAALAAGLTANPMRIAPGGTSALTAIATYSGTGSLTYTWNAGGGSISGSGSSVTWTAPQSEGSYPVSLTIEESECGLTGDASVNITVHQIVCSSDTDCDDGNPYTTDTCINPGTIYSSCSNVNPAPAAVTLGAPTSVATSSLVISWAQSDDADFASYKVYLSTSPGVSQSSTLVGTITTKTTTTNTVTGLSAETNYYFKVYVCDTGGLCTGSNEVSATTNSLPATNSPPVMTGLTASKTAVLSNNSDTTTLTASATDADGDTITYTGSVTGGALTKTSANTFTFKTNTPGEYTVTITASDGRGGTASRTIVIDSFGSVASEGAVKGTLNIPRTTYRTAVAGGPTTSENILSAPISIAQRTLAAQIPATSARFLNKGAPVVACQGDNFALGELIIKMKSHSDLASFAAANGLTVKKDSPSGISVVTINQTGADAALTRQLCQTLNNDSSVAYAELNHAVKALSITPNDPYFSKQWDLNLINVPQAWDITTGSSNVIVAVTDTGIDSGHQDIMGNLVSGYDFVSADLSCDGDGMDSNPEDVADSRCIPTPLPANSPDRSHYHGTHVAGTIAASGNNGIGVAGINWNAKIMPVRVLGAGGGYDSDIVEGMLYAARLSNASGLLPAHKAQIINMSLGGSPGEACSPVYQDVFTQVFNAGTLVFVASGNDSSDTAINPIALCPHAVAVSAVDRYSQRAWYSNAGPGVTIAAPGGDTSDAVSDGILSTVRDDNAHNNTAYEYMQGTSMATPHAAGVAALMLAADPALTPQQIVDIMTQTATDLGAAGADNVYGYGLVNAYEAVRTAANYAAPAQPVIAVSTTNMYFAPTDTSKTATIANTGGGALTVSSITDTETSGGNWLSASYSAGANSITLTATVDRTGLAAGTYTGTINITSNGGNATIQVTLQVDAPPPPTDPSCFDSTIWIIAVDSNTMDSAAMGQIPITGSSYNVFEIPQGDYYLVAGTDCNQDDYICDQNIDFCGIYPLTDAPDTVSVTGQHFTSNLDFSVGITVATAARRSGGNAMPGIIPKSVFRKLK